MEGLDSLRHSLDQVCKSSEPIFRRLGHLRNHLVPLPLRLALSQLLLLLLVEWLVRDNLLSPDHNGGGLQALLAFLRMFVLVIVVAIVGRCMSLFLANFRVSGFFAFLSAVL